LPPALTASTWSHRGANVFPFTDFGNAAVSAFSG